MNCTCERWITTSSMWSKLTLLTDYYYACTLQTACLSVYLSLSLSVCLSHQVRSGGHHKASVSHWCRHQLLPLTPASCDMLKWCCRSWNHYSAQILINVTHPTLYVSWRMPKNFAHWCYLPVRSKHGGMLTCGFSRRGFPELGLGLGVCDIRSDDTTVRKVSSKSLQQKLVIDAVERCWQIQ